MKQVTIQQFHDLLKAQSQPSLHLAFTCPKCKTVQSAADLIAAGAGENFEDVEKYLAFSCVGRFAKTKTAKKLKKYGFGCDWTLGGLFRIHTFEVVDDAGASHPRFEPTCSQAAIIHRMAYHPDPVPAFPDEPSAAQP